MRSEERAHRNEIEKHIKAFPNTGAVEACVSGLDPKDGIEFRTILVLCGLALGLVCAVGFIYASRL